MRNLLRTSLGCLFIALALNTAFTFAQALVPQPAQDAPWLQLNCHNKTMEQKPEWTVIITSKKPSIKQIRTNCWEISFTP